VGLPSSFGASALTEKLYGLRLKGLQVSFLKAPVQLSRLNMKPLKATLSVHLSLNSTSEPARVELVELSENSGDIGVTVMILSSEAFVLPAESLAYCFYAIVFSAQASGITRVTFLQIGV
jgi:hypothetical protein